MQLLRLLLLGVILLSVGCSGDKKDSKASTVPASTQPLPPEVEGSPEEATQKYLQQQRGSN